MSNGDYHRELGGILTGVRCRCGHQITDKQSCRDNHGPVTGSIRACLSQIDFTLAKARRIQSGLENLDRGTYHHGYVYRPRYRCRAGIVNSRSNNREIQFLVRSRIRVTRIIAGHTVITQIDSEAVVIKNRVLANYIGVGIGIVKRMLPNSNAVASVIRDQIIE